MIIAEIGTSHEGSLEKAKRLVDHAKDAGVDAVKFQWVYADEILHPKSGNVKLNGKDVALYERFKSLECSVSFYEKIASYAHSKNLQFICSPFGLRSLRELISIKPDAIKIASPELSHIPLLKTLADYRSVQKALGENPVPLIISSGVSKLADIEKAFDILGKENVSLLHCITSYPAPETEYNVKLVETLANIFGVPVGISDHSLDPILVPAIATAFGSVITEKHITISKDTDGLDDPIALNSEQFACLVYAIHECNAAILKYGKLRGRNHILKELRKKYGRKKIASVIGTGVKELAPSEEKNYGRTNRSLHFTKDLSAGSIINEEDISVLRTEKVLNSGLPSEHYYLLLGTRLTRDVKSGEGVQWEDVLQKNEEL